MEKRGISKLTIILGLLFIAIVIFSIVQLVIKKPRIEYYNDDPKTWVDDKPGNIKEISVDKVTKGESYVDAGGDQQYITAEIGTVFDLDGWYKGEYFKDYYEDENRNILIKIGQDVIPGDGIMEGFIIEKFENKEPFAYIFLDEDWKNKLPLTKIYWGKSFQNQKEFSFTEVSEGVYMDKIKDDPARFEGHYSLHHGGIMVGVLGEEKSTLIVSN